MIKVTRDSKILRGIFEPFVPVMYPVFLIFYMVVIIKLYLTYFNRTVISSPVFKALPGHTHYSL